jgi:formate dehydrogenase alpha subunit
VSKVLSTCPFCGCGCGILLDIKEETILASLPVRSHPVSRGTLCIKGWQGHHFVHSDKRLLNPLIKQNNHFITASWDQAVKTAAAGLARIKKESGPDAIGFIGSVKCTNEENFLFGKLARAVIGTNNIDTVARLYHGPTITSLGTNTGFIAANTSILDIQQADLLFILGLNAKDQVARIGSYLLQAAKKGIPCILVDPRIQEHSRFFTSHLQMAPGADYYLLLGLLNYMLTEGLYTLDVNQVRKLQKGLPACDLAECERQTGIPRDQVVHAAKSLGVAKKALFIYGSGLTQQANGSRSVGALRNLAILTGNADKQGSGLLPVMYSNNMHGAIDMGLVPNLLPGYQSLEDKSQVRIFESSWNCQFSTKAGLSFQEMLNEAGKSIRALYIMGENVLLSAPNYGAVSKALAKLDLLIVQDLFLTQTAEMAHIVLPASSFAEKDGTFTNTERRVQRITRAIPSIGNSKPDCEIISHVASEFGHSFSVNPQAIFEEITKLVPQYKGFDFKELERVGGQLWPGNGQSKTISIDDGNHSTALTDFCKLEKPGEISEAPDDDYPFTLFTGRIGLHRMTGTLTAQVSTLKREFPNGTAEMTQDDARSLGVRAGWKVKIATRRGEITRTVVINNSLEPKTVFVPVHDADGVTIAIMNDALEAESKIPEMKMCAAKVESTS